MTTSTQPFEGEVIHEPHTVPPAPQRIRISMLAGLLAIVFVVLLVMLSNVALFDLNRLVNPTVLDDPGTRSALLIDTEPLSEQTVSYTYTNQQKYELYKLLIYAGAIIPLVLLIAALWMMLRKSERHGTIMLVGHALAIYAAWMLFQLVRLGTKVMMEQYKHLSLYGLLIIFTVICLLLMIVLQRRKNAHA